MPTPTTTQSVQTWTGLRRARTQLGGRFRRYSPSMAKVVRTAIRPNARLPTRRTLDERFFVRRPTAYSALSWAVLRLPPRSHLRRALLRRAFLRGWGAWQRGDLDVLLLGYA